MRAIILALLLAGCAPDINGYRSTGGSPAAICTQAGSNLITCKSK